MDVSLYDTKLLYFLTMLN